MIKDFLQTLNHFFYGPLKHHVNTQSKSPVFFLAEQLKSWFPGKGSSLLWNHFWKTPQKHVCSEASLCQSPHPSFRTGQKSFHCNTCHQSSKCTTSDFCSIGSTFTFLFRKNREYLQNANKAPLLCTYLAVGFRFAFQVDIIQVTRFIN